MSNAVQTLDGNISLDGAAGVDQYLTFIMAEEEYGVDILRVQEIRGWDSATPIPNTPAYIRGVINLRGVIVPIVDLRERFGIDTIDYGPTTVVIVLRVEGSEKERIMGIVVDAVSDVYNVKEGEMKPAPDFGSVVSIDFVRGLVTIEEKMIIMLEIDQMLSDQEMGVVLDDK